MGVIVNKEQEKDELSQRIAADLRNKTMQTVGTGDAETDFAEDAEYLKDLKKTGKFGWVWIVLVVLAVISLISIILI